MKRSFTNTTMVKLLCLWLAFASPFIINAQCPIAGSNWTVRTAPANTWNAVAYGNNVFVAVGSGSSDYVMTSPDGITWTARTAPAGDWRSIAFGNGKFVAVGNNDDVVISSTDGITWATGTAIEYTNWTSVTYGNGLFVAVSDGGFRGAMVSSDGILWAQVSGSETTFINWRGITYGNGVYVAVSNFASVVSSPNAINWTSHNIPTNANLTSVTYGNGTFVAVAEGGFHRVITSSNGADWTTQTAAEEIAWQSVTYGNGTFVAVSSDGTNRVMTSQDGSNWTIRAATEANTWRSVTFGNNLFVAVSSDGANRVMTSAGLGQPTISIVSDQGNTISSGTSVTFTATITSGGATPTYQWKKNNVNVGTNSATYTDAAIANNDVITCVVSQTPTCMTTSNSITMSICSPPALSIAANPGTSIIAGTSVTFTATPTNGGAMPSYQWVKNGLPVGSNSATYTDATLINDDFIYCEMTISQACEGIDRAFSNFIEMTVCTPTSPSISIAASTDPYMPSGTSVTFTATPTLGGTTPAYQWKKNDVNVGSNSATYTSTTLVNNDVITCVLTSNDICASLTTANSNSITITICPSSVMPSVSIVSNAGTNINSGTSVTFTATPTNGGSTPTYQWKKNGTNVGSNSTTYTTTTLVTNDVISCVLTSSTLCASPTTATSNSLTMTVGCLPSVSIAASPSVPIVLGTKVTFTATPTNEGAGPIYQWKVNGSNVGSNSATYTTTTLAANDVVTCVLTGNAACLTTTTATSNSITISTKPNQCLDYTSSNKKTDLGNPATLQLTDYTIEIWFYPRSNTTSILAKGASRAAISDKVFDLFGNGTVLRLSLTNKSSVHLHDVSSYANLLNKWNHVAIVKSGTSITTYLNGANQVNSTMSFTPDISTFNWYIAGNVSFLFDGKIDEVRFWSTARTLEEIRTDMSSILDGTESNLVAYYDFNNDSNTATVFDKTTPAENGTNTNITSLNSVASYAPVGDVTIANQTNIRSLWQSTGTSSSFESDGLTMAVASTLTESNYVVFGHNNAGGNLVTTDLAGTTAGSRYSQTWYANVTGTVSNTSLTFDLGTIAGSTVTVSNASNYTLLYRSGTSGNFTNVANASSFANGDQIIFTGINLQNGYYTVGNAVALPVELLNFTGKNTGGGNLLTWTTAHEVNNKGFQIERLNGNDWQNIGFKIANNKASSYQFLDNAPLSTSYYRLRQIDNDGKETLSKVISIAANGDGKLKAYPNPVSNTLTIETGDANAHYQIINLLGQTILRGQTPSAGARMLDVSALSKGSYVLKVGAEQVKFVKQ